MDSKEKKVEKAEKERQLSLKQEWFCQHYTGECDGNATKAAIKAGYSPVSAHDIGCKNLKNAKLKKRIRELLHQASIAAEVTIELVVAEHKKIATVQITDYYLPADLAGKFEFKPMSEWTDGMRSAVKKMELKDGKIVRIELHSKDAALTALAGIGGYVKPKKIEHSGAIETKAVLDFSNMETEQVWELMQRLEGAAPEAESE